jgi:hypothetical protein
MEREVGELRDSAPAILVGRGSGIAHDFKQSRSLILAAGLRVLKTAEPLRVLSRARNGSSSRGSNPARLASSVCRNRGRAEIFALPFLGPHRIRPH